ncbi:hypothetical protein DFP72DRAFT_884940 [Ephemerocybe angulata]|uniref:Uncharacterized protein n=1 Tax=Ephemerocybe angulata TaxID=980116 RepID=A0A8H6I7K8_9AGAR|nr:hypothetical protein DFP72DRAFT_884940 [Tulosesus angulatus]
MHAYAGVVLTRGRLPDAGPLDPRPGMLLLHLWRLLESSFHKPALVALPAKPVFTSSCMCSCVQSRLSEFAHFLHVTLAAIIELAGASLESVLPIFAPAMPRRSTLDSLSAQTLHNLLCLQLALMGYLRGGELGVHGPPPEHLTLDAPSRRTSEIW